MKTYNFSTRNRLLKSIIGLLGLTVTSCGTYQNKSYYDNDGIYGAEKQEKEIVSSDNGNKPVSEANQKYKEYFGSNANNYSIDQSETFTDVENYSSENDTIEGEDYKNYGAWGDNNKDVTINVYNNDWGWNNYYGGGYWDNYWAYRPWGNGIYLGWNSWNYGWNNPYWGYYGSGWNNPYYGGYYGGYYGYNNWNNGYYYGNHYAHNHGRRGSSYGGRYATNNVVSSRDYTRTGRRNSNITPRNNYNSQNPRTTDHIRPRRDNTRPGTNSETIYNTPRPRRTNTESEIRPRNESVTPRPRSENNTPRTYTPTRTESSSPRGSYDSPRSSSSGSSGSSSSGGGRSGGGRRG